MLAQGRLKDLGPLLADLGRRDARPRRHERPRLGAPLLRDLPRDALHRDRAPLVRRSAASGSSSPAAALAYHADRARPRARHDLAAARGPTHKVFCPQTGGLALRQDCQSYQLVKSLYSIAQRRLRRHRARQGHVHDAGRPPADPVPEHRLHLLGARPGARPDRRRRAAARLHALRRARDEDRAAGRRRLLEAARRRPHVRLRAADVHHRRRRPAADPADRNHAAVRLVRRLVGGRELPAARRAAARLQPGQRAAT